jgi:micrococcal nuclease
MRVSIAFAFALAGLACGDRSQLGDGGKNDTGPRSDGGVLPAMVMVDFVIDGDTIVVNAGADLETPDSKPLDGETIRFIGVDAPEIEHPPEPAECYGNEAKAFTEGQIGGRIIEISYDLPNGIRDEFGRLLAYVDRSGVVVNERLIETGHARAFRQFPHRDRSAYIALEDEAKRQNLGLWSCP